MAFTFKMRTDGREPIGQFAIDSASITRTYVLFDEQGESVPVPAAQVHAWIRTILGTTLPGPAAGPVGAPGGAGSLVRLMPMPDPMYRGLFADTLAVRINSSEGYAANAPVLGGVPLAVPPVADGFAEYTGVEFDVNSTARPYALVPNARMTSELIDYYEIDGTRRRLTAYPEWKRFTQRFAHAVDSRVSANVAGGMVFWAPGQPPEPPRVGAGPPHNAQLMGVPDMMVPDVGIKWRWFGVPRRYVESQRSYLARYRGFINQQAFSPRAGVVWPKGSLLYVNCETIRTYTPPQFAAAFNSDPVLNGSFDAEVLCDFELSFILTFRTRGKRSYSQGDVTDDPNATTNTERPNNSWVDDGHNWQPHFYTKEFHYAHTNPLGNRDDKSRWQPYYNSAPIPQILFQDPDVPAQIVVI